MNYRIRIAAERRRQVVDEKFAPTRDVRRSHELLLAAACYSRAADIIDANMSLRFEPPAAWPWHVSFWKPGSPERMREKAGALALAAIDAMAAVEK